MNYEVGMNSILDEIKTNQQKLITLLENPNNKKEMYKWLKTELAYTSNAIEGNTLTRKETELVIDNGITSTSKPLQYYIEAVNHAKAFEKIIAFLDENKNINENFMLNIHKIILTGLDDDNAGFYRNCRVRISGSTVIMPNPIKVPDLMTDFYNWLSDNMDNEPLTAILVHLKFVSIHPFVDGNGRCARLLMNTILLKFGFAPIVIRPTDRKKYLSVVGNYQLKGDDKPYINFMLNILNRSLKVLITMLDTDIDVEPNELLTISKYAKLKGVPVSTIRYWVKTGKVKPASYTDSGYMLFKKD